MSTQLQVPIVRTANLPADYCWPDDPQQYFEDIVSRMIGQFVNNLSGIIISDSAPGPNDRDKLWFDTNGGDNNLYSWVPALAAWARKHPLVANGSKRVWFPLETDLATEDGGAAGPIGDAAGPFWVEDTTMSGRFPLARGLIPSSSPPVTVVSGATGGTYRAITDVTQLPEHVHTYKLKGAEGTDLDPATARFAALPDSPGSGSGALPDFTYNTSAVGVASGTLAPPTFPDYIVGVWAYRSARIWILAP